MKIKCPNCYGTGSTREQIKVPVRASGVIKQIILEDVQCKDTFEIKYVLYRGVGQNETKIIDHKHIADNPDELRRLGRHLKSACTEVNARELQERQERVMQNPPKPKKRYR